MTALAILDCVGLTPRHLGLNTPNLNRLAEGGFVRPLAPALPAVTTTGQVSMLTGVAPRQHGIVGNGWYFRDLNEILLWRQSEGLIDAPLVWEGARHADGQPWRVLKHFWWYAMATSATATVTPRPAYHHDGRKSPDIYAWPPDLKQVLDERHGTFPLFNFWGPMAELRSTRWIADSFRTAWDHTKPDLGLCYLPHLDYDLQRFGPVGDHLERNLRDLDACVGLILDHLRPLGVEVLVVSEYGLNPVKRAVFPNRHLREAGLLAIQVNATGELLDPGASRAFAVCDHQVAHVYIRNPHDVATAITALEGVPGVARVHRGGAALGLDHARCGELVLEAERDTWFAHDYWLDPVAAPDFARCVEIHKKPGYDPRELFFDPQGGKFRAAKALLRKKLGLRYVLDPCPLDPTLVRGSHGVPTADPLDGPILIGSDRRRAALPLTHHTDIHGLIRRILDPTHA